MATMLDVSKRAGVSKSTVSRVLNGTAKISETTRQAVFQAIEELNYRPNRLAQSLSTRCTNTIGLVTVISQAHYFSEMLEHCDEQLEQAGKQLIIALSKNQPEGDLNAIQMLVDRRCDAIVYYNNYYHQHTMSDDELSDLIDQLPIPMVVINRFLPRHPQHCVTFDQKRNARLPVDYLLQQGHRRIAYISGPLHELTAKLRLQGYQQALQDADIPLEPLLISEGNRDFSGGYNACKQLLQRGVKFTALCCFNDTAAVGALKALHQGGLSVPEDVSLFGMDNERMLEYTEPSISSVEQDVETLVTTAMTRLFALLEEAEPPTIKAASANLILRESIRVLPRADDEETGSPLSGSLLP